MDNKIIVYTLPTWGDCHEAKKFFSQNNIEYEERNAQEPGYRNELINKYRRMAVPTIIINNEVITGFAANREKIEKMLGL